MKNSRKIDIQKLQSEIGQQTDPQKIKSKITMVNKRNQKFQQDINNLIAQLDQQRQINMKLQKQINQSAKDRMQQIQKITLDANYTKDPQQRKQGIKKVTDRYQFMEMQNEKFVKNFENIDKNLQYYQKRLLKLQNQLSSTKSSNITQMQVLRKQFAKYKALQDEQNEKNRLLQEESDKKERYYVMIDKQISQYRGKYAIVQTRANKLENELKERIDEFQTRQRNDRQKYANAQETVKQLQYEMINLKNMINSIENKNVDLQIKDIETGSNNGTKQSDEQINKL